MPNDIRLEFKPRRQISRTRFWGLRVSLILFGLLPFLILELALRFLWTPPIADRVDPFLDCSQLSPLFELDGGDYRIRQDRLALFAPAHFKTIKEANTKRVFCVGGSTTQGEPYKPPTAFPAWLELNLRLIDPDQHWEVVNCGGLSYASYRLLPILSEVLQYKPDLIVVDCGHNEFLEERELSGWKRTPPIVVHTMRVARYSRLVQFPSNYFSGRSKTNSHQVARTRLECEVDALLDSQGGLEKYKRDELNSESVVKSMRWNINAMAEACNRAKVPMLLLIPTCNVRDCPPFKVELRGQIDADSEEQIELHWNAARRAMTEHEATSLRTPLEMSPVYELQQLLSIDPEHAGALYWLGQMELALGQFERARKHLIGAKDKDVCPLRAISPMQDAIREIAIAKKIWWFDVDAMFQSVSEHAIVGDQWLIDHVHPRIEGHQMLGERLAELLIEKGWVMPTNDGWIQERPSAYQKHLAGLGEDYFIRGKQRLEGLILWTQGRAHKGLSYPETGR